MGAGTKPFCLALGLCLGLTAVRAQDPTPSKSPAGAEVVVVTLRPEATVTEPRVTLGDVASIEGGDARLRQQIAKLDLADLPEAGQVVPILREQVYYQIRIGDVDPRLFRVEGAAQVRARFSRQSITDEDILAAAKQQVLQHVPEAPEDVSIQLAQPIRGLPATAGAKGNIRLEVDLHTSAIPLGRVQVDVAVFINGERRGVVPVYLDVKLYQRVAVCTRRIARGDLLSKDNIYFDRRAVTGLTDYLTSSQGLAGKQAKRPLAPGQALTSQDVEPAEPTSPVLVKRQALVKLVAQLGTLQLVTIGESLQDGQRGQLIRVRNVDSRKVVVGRVVDHAMVEVEY
jgi:flagella basal body P-ring formation protein FlgA